MISDIEKHLLTYHAQHTVQAVPVVVKSSLLLFPFSALTLRCWLGGRKGIRPVKKLSGGVLAWLMVICLERGADLHMSQLMPLPLTVCLLLQ